MSRQLWHSEAELVPTDERTKTMMYATLALMAGLIAIMFIATAVSSIVNAVRESEAVKNSLRRSAVL
jgi:ABC-type polysaccharide/polyol phosphate export permease